ncbi:uncharacterized protein LOC106655707 isoform X2 [Trichogramma pretiosum]|uniref:uncharacterized protein LOC106655707 isoform X2 n=1 Tax=Trichogramma pretiosum TaxID=7493 RepID=UPI0006C9D6D7|nr:uncharacterized protein LOC106655707 isoform X2 [Trichogramma pretiosum]
MQYGGYGGYGGDSPPSSSAFIKPKERVTTEQKQCIFEFVMDNPEIITHDSTPEREKVLWELLTMKLNRLTPVKSIDAWKVFLQRWRKSSRSNDENNLKGIDIKFKKYLLRLDATFNGTRKTQTIKEIDTELKQVVDQKNKLILKKEGNTMKIMKLERQIQEIKNENKMIQTNIQQLTKQKTLLNTKKTKLGV